MFKIVLTERGNIVRGTIMTATGDYRFLAGNRSGSVIRMSVFDASHSFLFDMRPDRPGQISGIFYSGNRWQESFVAERVDQDFGLVDPNCHDAAQLIGELKREFGAKGLGFLGVAFEHTDDEARSRRQVERFNARNGLDWNVVIGGVSDKKRASAVLPELSGIQSYPTTIFVRRDGTVHAIHSGFSGPATPEYGRLKAEFRRLAGELLGK